MCSAALSRTRTPLWRGWYEKNQAASSASTLRRADQSHPQVRSVACKCLLCAFHNAHVVEHLQVRLSELSSRGPSREHIKRCVSSRKCVECRRQTDERTERFTFLPRRKHSPLRCREPSRDRPLDYRRCSWQLSRI